MHALGHLHFLFWAQRLSGTGFHARLSKDLNSSILSIEKRNENFDFDSKELEMILIFCLCIIIFLLFVGVVLSFRRCDDGFIIRTKPV